MATLTLILLIIAALCLGAEAFLRRSILAAGLLARVLAALIPRLT